jgi:magnesium-transporting ATPase (P-type)
MGMYCEYCPTPLQNDMKLPSCQRQAHFRNLHMQTAQLFPHSYISYNTRVLHFQTCGPRLSLCPQNSRGDVEVHQRSCWFSPYTSPMSGGGSDTIAAHGMEARDVLKYYQVTEEKGLSSAQVAAARERYGPNELRQGEKTPLWKLVLEQFEDPLVITLLGAMMISLGTNLHDYYYPHGDERPPFWEGFVEPAVILFILIFNALVGVWQEANAENALEALKKLQADKVRLRSVDRVTGSWVQYVATALFSDCGFFLVLWVFRRW